MFGLVSFVLKEGVDVMTNPYKPAQASIQVMQVLVSDVLQQPSPASNQCSCLIECSRSAYTDANDTHVWAGKGQSDVALIWYSRGRMYKTALGKFTPLLLSSHPDTEAEQLLEQLHFYLPRPMRPEEHSSSAYVGCL